MITLQGELTCSTEKPRHTMGLRRDDDGFGDTDDVDRMRQSLGFSDPYGLATLDRYTRTPHPTREVVMPPVSTLCCKKDCKDVGACSDPVASSRNPAAACVRCMSGLCDGRC